MKRLLLLCALTMTACAPIAQLAQPDESARLTQDGLSLLVSNPGPESLTGDPSRNIPGGVLTVDGLGLTPDDQAKQWCMLNSSARWDCFVPEVKAGERVLVTFTSGVINDAMFTGYRASRGAVPVVLMLK
ncbi:hypothetical protein [Deinococcus humi]|uniref:Lipoprotein n=1 Tax=Deinococcus humi TaxID=662880 RepID=A0A7W8ND28_9DEIO|nr:hypothetical protein [Deinococcus humi]MBB5361185.1 hypothetical protein [Deinococcus humi]GGO18802.1 hypothetical protein GCM10008949_02540 [Deinococcus humi]